ncbi:hypothetical protein [Thalassiella azotivora]
MSDGRRGPDPTTGDDLDAAVEDAVAALRSYVTLARGVRGEFDPEQADLDPRVEESAVSLGLALGRLEDEFESTVGFVPTIEPMWEDDGGPVEDDEPEAVPPLAADAFSVGLVVGVDEGRSPDQLDGVIEVLDEAAGDLVARLEADGFVVSEYFVARGEHAGGGPGDDEGPLGPDEEDR